MHKDFIEKIKLIFKEDNLSLFKDFFQKSDFKIYSLNMFLSECCKNNSINIFNFLTKDKNLFFLLSSVDSVFPTYISAMENQSYDVIESILNNEKNFDVSILNNSAFHIAVENNDFEIAQKILKHKDFKPSFSVFDFLIKNGDLKNIKYLVEKLTPSSIKDYFGENCLIAHALNLGKQDIAEFLFFNSKFKNNISKDITLPAICRTNNKIFIDYINDNEIIEDSYFYSLFHSVCYDSNLFSLLLKEYTKKDKINLFTSENISKKHSRFCTLKLRMLISNSSLFNLIVLKDLILSFNFNLLENIFEDIINYLTFNHIVINDNKKSKNQIFILFILSLNFDFFKVQYKNFKKENIEVDNIFKKIELMNHIEQF